MRTQLRYELKNSQTARLILLSAALILNILLYVSFRHAPAKGFEFVFPIVLSGLIMTSLLAYAFVEAVSVFVRMYKTPQSYMTFLPAVPAHRLLFSRTLVILLDTLVPLILGLAGMVLQMSRYSFVIGWNLGPGAAYMLLLGLLQYALLLCSIFFVLAFVKSYLPYVRARMLLGVLLFFALSILSAYPALLLGLIHPASLSFEAFVALVNIPMGFNLPSVAYLVIIALELSGLFMITCKLMDKKLNL